jgi:hypothetical protein
MLNSAQLETILSFISGGNCPPHIPQSTDLLRLYSAFLKNYTASKNISKADIFYVMEVYAIG